jgi:branched-chain amino acid transport system substrate-binding protein
MLRHRRITATVGVDLDLTGPGARLGTVIHKALRLRVAQVDRALELRVLDNRSDPAVSTENLTDLVVDSNVIAIVASTPATIDPLGVPIIALPAVGAPIEPATVRPYLFQLAPDPVAVADMLAADLMDTRTTAVGIVTVDDPYGDLGVRALTDAAHLHGLDLVVHEWIADGADEQRVALLAAHVAGRWPRAVVLWTYPREAGLVARALRQSGWQGRLLLAASAADHPYLRGEDCQGLAGASMVFTETLVADTLTSTSAARAARKAWFRDYVAAYGRYDAYAAFGADAIDLVAAALDREGGCGPLRDSIEGTRLAGITGPIRFSPTDHFGLDPRSLTLLHAAGGRWHTSETLRPGT